MPPRPPSRGSAPRRLLGPFGSAPRRLLGPFGSAPRPVSVVVPCPRVPRRGSVPPERRVVVPCALFLFCTSKRAAGPEFAACRGDRAISSCTTGFRSCITGCEARPVSVSASSPRASAPPCPRSPGAASWLRASCSCSARVNARRGPNSRRVAGIARSHRAQQDSDRA